MPSPLSISLTLQEHISKILKVVFTNTLSTSMEYERAFPMLLDRSRTNETRMSSLTQPVRRWKKRKVVSWRVKLKCIKCQVTSISHHTKPKKRSLLSSVKITNLTSRTRSITFHLARNQTSKSYSQDTEKKFRTSYQEESWCRIFHSVSYTWITSWISLRWSTLISLTRQMLRTRKQGR